MVRKTCALMVVVAVIGWGAAAFAAGQAGSKGFGDAAWGSDLAKHPGFVKIKSLDGVDYFVNLREPAQVKGFDQPTVFYGSVGGKLYAVHLRLKEPGAYEALRQDLAQTFGPGRHSREAGSNLTRWRTGALKVKLKAARHGEVKLSFYYQPIAAKQAANLRDVEPGPTEDLLKLMPAGGNQLMPATDPAKPRQDNATGVDLMKLLRMGKGL